MRRVNWSAIQQTIPVRIVMKGLNDWLFNLSGLLAYNLLLAMFPLFLLVIGGLGLALQSLKPDSQQQLINELARTLPSEVSSGLIAAVTSELERATGALLVLGLVAAFFFGSRLFLTIEDCFTIIYRGKPRSPLRRNIMALGMTLLFLVLVPIMFLGSAVPALLTNQIVQRIWHTQPPGFIGQAAGFVGAYLAAFLWLLLIYMLIPDRRVSIRHSWPGAALAAALFIIYDLLFPWFASALLQPGKYGATAGFLILLLSFFYYFGLLLLIGAELNSWLEGHREALEDVPTMLHHAIIHGQLPQVPSDATAPMRRIADEKNGEEPPPDNTSIDQNTPDMPTPGAA
ncbi:MAG TPA: YihY/virulence factor BrkB family protein [Ktedonobacterales bacterium]|nr:YihY/virulence factor BrkB family protein [Ktedonobacterales bacterium]